MISERNSFGPFVTSKDGTWIEHQPSGHGPAVVLVGGPLDDGTENAPLAGKLAIRGFRTYNYTRRGRGNSLGNEPYAVEREIEDIDTLIEEAGGSAHLYGLSSGGALALEAAAAGSRVGKVAVYEPPYCVDHDTIRAWQEYRELLYAKLAHEPNILEADNLLRLVGYSDEDLVGLRKSGQIFLLGLARTLAYDAACVGDGKPPADRLVGITQPVLVATGRSLDPPHACLRPDFFVRAADAVAARVPHARRLTLPGPSRIPDGQSRTFDSTAMAGVLERYFLE